MMGDQTYKGEINLSLSSKQLIDIQNDNTFCKSIINLMSDKKLSSSERYFINDDELLHKVVEADDKIFHVLLVPSTLIEYILNQTT